MNEIIERGMTVRLKSLSKVMNTSVVISKDKDLAILLTDGIQWFLRDECKDLFGADALVTDVQDNNCRVVKVESLGYGVVIPIILIEV